MSQDTPIRYLLGELDAPAVEALEDEIFGDDAVYEDVRAAEAELFDAYAANELGKDRRTRFETRFLATERGRQRLAFANALREKAREAEAARAPGFFAQLFSTPVRRFATVAAMAVVLFIVALYVIPPSPTVLHPTVRGGDVVRVEMPSRGDLKLVLALDPDKTTTRYEVVIGEWSQVFETERGAVSLDVAVPVDALAPGDIEIELRAGGETIATYFMRLEP